MSRLIPLRWVVGAFTVVVSCQVDERSLRLGSESAGRGGSKSFSDAGSPAGGEVMCDVETCFMPGDGGSASTPGGAPAIGEGGRADGGTASMVEPGGAGAGGTPAVPRCPDRNGNGIADCDETLVMNGAYEHDVNSWLKEAGVAMAWEEYDSEGFPASGSAGLTYEGYQDSDGNGIAGSVQCIALGGATKIDIWADILVKGGQATGQGLVNVLFYPTNDCAGPILPTGAYGTPAASIPARWTTVSGTAQVPAGAGSMRVRLGVSKPFRNPKLEVVFDNVLIDKR